MSLEIILNFLMERFNTTGEDMSLYLSIICYILINQSHLVDLERPKRYIFSCKCSFKSQMVF